MSLPLTQDGKDQFLRAVCSAVSVHWAHPGALRTTGAWSLGQRFLNWPESREGEFVILTAPLP